MPTTYLAVDTYEQKGFQQVKNSKQSCANMQEIAQAAPLVAWHCHYKPIFNLIGLILHSMLAQRFLCATSVDVEVEIELQKLFINVLLIMLKLCFTFCMSLHTVSMTVT